MTQSVSPKSTSKGRTTTTENSDTRGIRCTNYKLFPKNHTAVFAPAGEAISPKYGTISVKPSTPPKEDVKQPDWNDAQPDIYELDNQSLIESYMVLKKCMNNGHIGHSSPASFRYNTVLDELLERANTLNNFVEYYIEANICDEDEMIFAKEYINRILKDSEAGIGITSL